MTDVTHPRALTSVLRGLEGLGAGWALLRPLPDPGGRDGDVDVLVAPGCLADATAVALAEDFARVPGQGRGVHLLRYDAGPAEWIWLHLVDELSFGPGRRFQTRAEQACLARTDSREGARMLHPADEFWATLMHNLLDKGAVRAKNRERLQALARTGCRSGPLYGLLRSLAPHGFEADAAEAMAVDGRWAELASSGAMLAEAWQRGGPVRGPRTLRGRLSGAVARRLRGWHRRGISVALVGPDGAGKSTLAAEITRHFVFPTRTVYMGLTGGVLRRILRLRVPGVVFGGRLLVVWGRYLYARYLQARGHLVIFDRYVYDAAVPTPQRLTPGQQLSRRLTGYACPAPDLVFVLSAPGEVMFARKRAYSAEQLEDWRRHFLALQARLPNVVVLDTTRPLAAVRAEAIGQIWSRYSARWR